MEDAEKQQLQACQGLIKLSSFRTEDLVSWFRWVEGQFTLQDVANPIARY
jgi:hypothetical protein